MDVAEFVEIMTEPVPCQTAETGEARQTGHGDTTVKLAGAVGAQPAFVAPQGSASSTIKWGMVLVISWFITDSSLVLKRHLTCQ